VHRTWRKSVRHQSGQQKKLRKFIQKQELTVPLISDPDNIAIEGRGVWIQKKLYGREYMGVDWDGSGKITHGVVEGGHRRRISRYSTVQTGPNR
ncbi:MAG: hypothetical protein MJ014_02445, partial [Methanocorpusculum sp.]|nr:hypothetical protein [Methanocorpusculum sp.]